MKKVFIMLTILVLSLSNGVITYADNSIDAIDDSIVAPCYTYTNSVSSLLSISNSKATCKSYVNGISGKVTKIVVTQTLQKRDGNSWRRVTSWSKTYTSYSCTYSNTYSSLAGGTYRVKTEAKVYSGTAYETVYAYSTQKSC